MTGFANASPSSLGRPRPASRLGVVFASVWLFFLIDPVLAGLRADDRTQGLAGVGATVAFGAVYMSVWLRMRSHNFGTRGVFRPTLGQSGAYMSALIALGTLMMITLGEPGIAATVYVAVGAVMSYRPRTAVPVVAVVVVTTLCLGFVPGWGSQVSVAFSVAAASLAVYGIRTVIARNADLLDAEAANAELAVENERSRFARDLHDILGHSLTVITVKAELAGRLLDVEPADLPRARREIADLERLSRDALADVRHAVSGYRELTLPGELLRAREALAAAEIEASLPGSTDEVPSDLRELFAWTVREGVTNVIRHSGAGRCEVRLSADGVEVRDDGAGAPPHAGGDRCDVGSGLTGLRERAALLDATLTTRALEPGWSLAVRR